MEIKLKTENFEEIKEAWAGMSKAERNVALAAALEKTKQDIKTEVDKTATNHEL